MIKLLISWSEYNKLTDTVISSRFGFNSIFQMFAHNQLRNSNLRMVLFTQQLLQIFLLNHTNLGVDLFTGSLGVTWGTEWLHLKKKKNFFWPFTQFCFYYIIGLFLRFLFVSLINWLIFFTIQWILLSNLIYIFLASFLIQLYLKKILK